MTLQVQVWQVKSWREQGWVALTTGIPDTTQGQTAAEQDLACREKENPHIPYRIMRVSSN